MCMDLRLDPLNLIWVMPAKGNDRLHSISNSPQTEQISFKEKIMKRFLFCVLAVCFVLVLVSCGNSTATSTKQETASDRSVTDAETISSDADRELTVYAYDSFVSDWGPGPVIASGFEEKYGIKVNLLSMGDSGQVLQRAILEKDDPKADVIIGIDNNLLSQALAEEIFTPYDSPALKSIDADLIFDKTLHVLPFDYGFFSIIYDSQTISTPPTSLEDLTAPEYAKKLIIMDPRTSSPGLGFLLWTIAVYGDSYPEYWERLKPSLLTVTDGWDTGYGLFTNGEAPMVLSYTTSPAYHVEYEDTTRYLAAMFPEGHYLQIEGAGIVNGAEHADLARLFIDYLLGEDAQRVIPLTNWMYPTNSTIELPKSYEYAPRPEHMLTMSSSTITDSLDDWLKTLTNIMSR